MILIISNKEKNTSLFIPVGKLRGIRAYKEYEGNFGEKDKKDEWGIAFEMDSNCENEYLMIVGDEDKARNLVNQLPYDIYNGILEGCDVMHVSI